MTASTTVGGIQQLDNDNLDMGTNDFTVTWEGALPDYTPAATLSLVRKNITNLQAGFLFTITTAGLISFVLRDGLGATNTYNSTIATGIADKSFAKITVVVVRETASVAGSVTFYVNGIQLGAAVAITAGTPFTLSNAVALLIGAATSSSRAECNLQASRLFNRALTAAEVLDLSNTVVALADRGASQTPVYTSDFSAGVDGWAISGGNQTLTGNEDGIDGEDDWAKLEKTVNAALMCARRSATLTADKNNEITVKLNNPGGSTIYVGSFLTVDLPVSGSSSTTNYVAVPSGSSATLNIKAVPTITRMNLTLVNSSGLATNASAGTIFYFKSVQTKQIGLTSELLASNAQSNTGQIFDTSGNKNHALLPASGATVVGRPVSQTREVRWTNTWAGTNELQYIGGVNQAILPANAYIESIVGTVSGATPHDIIIGDGSDADRYVTITTGLAAGTTNFALAARTTDGTNLKLTVDPDTDATMSIAWVIRYSVLE
jgi:hypothetical protein